MIKSNRHNIPMLIISEGIHGLMLPNSTVFPQSIGMASAFNVPLMEKVGKAIGTEARKKGIRQLFAPNIDISRESRWGRTEENYGEDP